MSRPRQSCLKINGSACWRGHVPGRIQNCTIGFGGGIGNCALPLLQQCATSNATYFYNPASDELIGAFQKLAAGADKLRIAK